MKLKMLTCYDATFAKICADAQCLDYLLVGDSLGTVISGKPTTTEVTMAQMYHHVSAVAEGLKKSAAAKKPILIADMPIRSYEREDSAIENAKILIRAGADMVKVEGPVKNIVTGLRDQKIRVCGHIGLTPQTITDYKVQGKSETEALRLKNEATSLEMAGAELLVLEMIPAELSKEITLSLKIPTIGIGAGKDCGGQVLVLYDLLGFNADFNPKFLKKYAEGYDWVMNALKSYASEVSEEKFPDSFHSFKS